MLTVDHVQLSDALLQDVGELVRDEPYAQVVEDLQNDLDSGGQPAVTVAGFNDSTLCGIGVLVAPAAPNAPWSVQVVVPASRSECLKPLLEAACSKVAGGSRVEWWVRGPLVDYASSIAKGNGFTAGRRIELMKVDVDAFRPMPEAASSDFDVEPSQLQNIVEINNAAFADHADRSSWTLETVENEIARLGVTLADIRVLLDDQGKPVGFVWTRLVRPGVGEIYVLAVHPQAHASGFGKSLLTAGVRHLRTAHDVKTVVLYVDSDNTNAINLYNRYGFENADEPLVSHNRTF